MLTIAHVAIALGVTSHVLARKRDVRAAIGWIGISWLSPFFGSALYFGFGINRVHRKARRLRGRDGPESFARTGSIARDQPGERREIAVGAITGLDLKSGHVAEVLKCGDEGYPPMLEAIEGAKRSVALASYIFRADEPGMAFIEALARAHERGVKVRVLVDGIGGGFFLSPAYHALRRRGVPAARFLHSVVPWRMPLLDLRLHKKALIVDDETAFIGGLNIGAENLCERDPAHPVRDVHFRLEGAVVRQIADDFDDDWTFATGEDSPDGRRHPLEPPPPEGAARARAIATGPDQTIDQLILVLMSAITLARRSIRIATPYFLPEDRIMTALQLAALRGVEVKIAIPAISDHKFFAWATSAHIRPLVEAGCHMFRSPPPFNHSKLMSVDDEWSLIGSANWDARSLRLNFELTVEVYDPELAKRLGGLVDGMCVDPITLDDIDGRFVVTKMRDASVRLLAPYL